MAKYIDADKLINALEKSQQNIDEISAKHGGKNSFRMGRQSELDLFRRVIASLQQEQPVKELEEAPREIYILQSKLAPNSLGVSWHDHIVSSNTCNNIKYIRTDLDKQSVDELEDDKIIDYAHSKFYYDKDFDGYGHSKFRPVLTREDLISFARHFAEWQKSQMLIKSSKKEIDEFMSRCDRNVLDELNRWRFTTACQEFIEQGIFDYGCAKHFAEWGKNNLK